MVRDSKKKVVFDWELFSFAFDNLKKQKMRSYLTLLGVVIGIAAIVALVAVGEGLNISITEEFEKLGTNTLVVLPGASFTETVLAELQEDDVDVIESVRGVEFASEIYIETGRVVFEGETKSFLLIGADTSKMEQLGALGMVEVDRGRELCARDRFSVLMGGKLAEKGFEDKTIHLRQTITVEGYKMKVVGITKTATHSFGSMFNNAILVNTDTLKEISDDPIKPARIIVSVDEAEDIEEVKESIEERLEKDHGEKDFQVIATQQISEIAGGVLGLIQLVLLGIASLALLVGGIGIMNTMLMAVMERTKEIGIMKSVGATNRRILSIFLVEAGLIGLIGGILGLLLGAGIAGAISSVATMAGFELPVYLSIYTIVGALAFSMVVGMISGVYPARRAAKMDPVEALQFE